MGLEIERPPSWVFQPHECWGDPVVKQSLQEAVPEITNSDSDDLQSVDSLDQERDGNESDDSVLWEIKTVISSLMWRHKKKVPTTAVRQTDGGDFVASLPEVSRYLKKYKFQ